jgi:hypothetical protein
LPLFLEVGEKLLELPCLFGLRTLFNGRSVHLERPVLLLWDLQSHQDDFLQINLGRHV